MFMFRLRLVVVQVQKRDCKIDWLWVRSALEEMKYLFKFKFSILRSDGGVVFRHSTRNASRIRRKVVNGVIFMYVNICILRI